MYRNWSEEDFKVKMPINRTAFNFIFDGIYEDIFLTPTNLKANPTSPDRQLALTIYRLATIVLVPSYQICLVCLCLLLVSFLIKYVGKFCAVKRGHLL